MMTPRRTQKQISNKYQGNLGYYTKAHLWRLARFLVSFFAIAVGVAIVISYRKQGDERFFSSGPLSRNHAALADNCASCHGNSLLTGPELTQAKIQKTVSNQFHHGIAFDPIDNNCEICHFTRDKRTYALHEVNVVKNRSCSVCHQEHQGPGPLRWVAGSQCASCHNNPQTMEASAQKGMQQHWDNLQRHPHPAEQIVFELPRPVRGYTEIFPSFWDGHPEFQLKRDAVHDPDLLKFNHARHFAADVPFVNGQRLECNYCHKPDSEGRYYQRITFVANCQACHSLQFDPKNPELMLPHGNTTAVRGFLRTLPTQYADLAAKKGITRPNEIKTFVTKQMLQLRERVRSGEDFEQQVFFAADPYKPQRETEPRVRASFYGCALCHDVQPVANAAPFISKPTFVDRWMPQSSFDHAKHTMVKCDECHRARQSRETTDVLMPGIASCVTCHSPKGKVVAECITCHTYHAPAMLTVASTSLGSGAPETQP